MLLTLGCGPGGVRMAPPAGRMALPGGSVPTGGVIGDDTTPATPDRRAIELVTRQWSGTQQRVVGGIPLLSQRWTDGHAYLPGDGRIADKAHDGVTTRLRPGAGDGSGGAGRSTSPAGLPGWRP